MAAETLHIKNMVCRRCVMAVEDICKELGIKGADVILGSVSFETNPDPATMNALQDRLIELGFEPLKSQEFIVLEKIKSAVRYYARHYSENYNIKLSAYIERAVKLDFRYASRLFSTLEGRTIMSYLMLQRIEYVKELLFDSELTLAEIADKVGFSSVAHLSRTFKKVEHLTISEFRDFGFRAAIDEI